MLEKLQEIIRKFTDDEDIVITGETVLLTDLGMNSYELINLVVEVEKEFKVEIPDRIIGSFKTVKNVLDFMEQK